MANPFLIIIFGFFVYGTSLFSMEANDIESDLPIDDLSSWLDWAQCSDIVNIPSVAPTHVFPWMLSKGNKGKKRKLDEKDQEGASKNHNMYELGQTIDTNQNRLPSWFFPKKEACQYCNREYKQLNLHSCKKSPNYIATKFHLPEDQIKLITEKIQENDIMSNKSNNENVWFSGASSICQACGKTFNFLGKHKNKCKAGPNKKLKII